MKIFFDESGQTGCVLTKKEILNFKDNPTFALGAVVVNEEDERRLVNKYLKFKEKFDIQGEIKGTDLLTKENNDKLKYFLRYVLDDVHYYINIYDKKFYLSTLILFSFCGVDAIKDMKMQLYNQASIIALQDDDFFVEYLNYIENPSVKAFSKYLCFIINYKYKYFNNPNGDEQENALAIFAEYIKNNKLEESFWEDFMTYGWYKDDKITNLINLNALYELIYFIKYKNNMHNEELELIHDHIAEFEETIQDELSSSTSYNIEFKDSKEELLLQIIDNVVSIFRHAYDRGVYYNKNKMLWNPEAEWDLKLLSKLQQKVLVSHIKYTIPLCDQASALCIRDMFSEEYPKGNRKNLFFNRLYIDYLQKLNFELLLNKMDLNDVNDLMNDEK